MTSSLARAGAKSRFRVSACACQVSVKVLDEHAVRMTVLLDCHVRTTPFGTASGQHLVEIFC
jgi:hypothetical protein